MNLILRPGPNESEFLLLLLSSSSSSSASDVGCGGRPLVGEDGPSPALINLSMAIPNASMIRAKQKVLFRRRCSSRSWSITRSPARPTAPGLYSFDSPSSLENSDSAEPSDSSSSGYCECAPMGASSTSSSWWSSVAEAEAVAGDMVMCRF